VSVVKIKKRRLKDVSCLSSKLKYQNKNRNDGMNMEMIMKMAEMRKQYFSHWSFVCFLMNFPISFSDFFLFFCVCSDERMFKF